MGQEMGRGDESGALISFIARMPWQQQPQQEQELCPLDEATFIIQLTIPCDSASRLISKAAFFETLLRKPARCPFRPTGP